MVKYVKVEGRREVEYVGKLIRTCSGAETVKLYFFYLLLSTAVTGEMSE